ncbi:MAG: alpha/beta hydrolase [Bermanella sp.]
MKKTLLLSGLLISTLLFGLILFAPAKLGHFIYDNATDLEANLYGFESHTIDIGEMNIYLYQNILSERESILMLHGYSADKDVWPRFARHFNEQYNVIIPDMAGHGETGYNKNWDYSAPAQVERLIKLLDKLNIQKVHIVGNSMGGFISAHFAKMYPQRILSATFIDPYGVNTPQPSKMEKLLTQGKNAFIVNSRAEFDNFYAMTMAAPPWFPDFIFDAVTETYVSRQDELAGIFSYIHQLNMLDNSLNEINVPSLLFWGELDQILDVSGAQVWQKGIEGIKVKVWPNVGHMPMLEIPQQTAMAFQAFLSELP